MVSTQLKNISQIGNLPQVGVKIKKYLKPPTRAGISEFRVHHRSAPGHWTWDTSGSLDSLWKSCPAFFTRNSGGGGDFHTEKLLSILNKKLHSCLNKKNTLCPALETNSKSTCKGWRAPVFQVLNVSFREYPMFSRHPLPPQKSVSRKVFCFFSPSVNLFCS